MVNTASGQKVFATRWNFRPVIQSNRRKNGSTSNGMPASRSVFSRIELRLSTDRRSTPARASPCVRVTKKVSEPPKAEAPQTVITLSEEVDVMEGRATYIRGLRQRKR